MDGAGGQNGTGQEKEDHLILLFVTVFPIAASIVFHCRHLQT